MRFLLTSFPLKKSKRRQRMGFLHYSINQRQESYSATVLQESDTCAPGGAMGSPVLLSDSKTEQYNLKNLSPSGRRVAPPLPIALRETWSMFHRNLQVYISRIKPIQTHFSHEECCTVSIHGDFQDSAGQSYEQPGLSSALILF